MKSELVQKRKKRHLSEREERNEEHSYKRDEIDLSRLASLELVSSGNFPQKRTKFRASHTNQATKEQ